ncbi:MAG: McrB family protein [Actinomycetota bacterium]
MQVAAGGTTSAGRPGAAEIEVIASRIFDDGWVLDGSVFTPQTHIWTAAHVGELFTYFVENPDLSSGATFWDKLERQIEPCSDGATQLMAEVLLLNQLPLADLRESTKRSNIRTVLAWCDRPVQMPSEVADVFGHGVFNGGRSFTSLRWEQLSLLIQMLREFKGLDEQRRRALLEDPWGFRQWVFGASGPRNPSQRNSLLYLAFPQFFEPIVSEGQKRRIRQAFSSHLDTSSENVDQDLKLIRRALEEEMDGPIDFYKPPLVRRWRPKEGPVPPDTPARRGWLVRGASVVGHNLVPRWLEDGWCSLAASHLPPVESGIERERLREMVEAGYSYVSYNARQQKVNEFDAFVNRMQVGDIVVTTSSGKIYLGVVTGEAAYEASPGGRSNLRRTVAWRKVADPVAFSDLPNPLPARLASQHDVVDLTQELLLLERLLGEESPTAKVIAEAHVPDAGDQLATELLVERSWLQDCIELLRDHRQIIFYGPPGTGKTYIAQHLAWHIAGREQAKLVQFHPAYSYEDFFEGFRPTKARDGQVGFELTPGPFRTLVDQAREHPEQPYVLVVDEINRANLAKVFGELYFLLEYRDEAIDLLYSPEQPFTLPVNVFLIGTMNTADRSIALVDSAMRRRFAFVALHPSEEPTQGLLRRWLERNELPAEPAALLDELNARIKDDDFKIGPSYLMRRSVHERDGGLERVWRNSIMPLLQEHHYGEAIDLGRTYGLESLRKALAATEGEIGTGSGGEAPSGAS